MLNVLMSFNWANIKILGDSAGGAECPSSQAEQANCCIEKAVCKAGRVFSVTEFACPICEKHSARSVRCHMTLSCCNDTKRCPAQSLRDRTSWCPRTLVAAASNACPWFIESPMHSAAPECYLWTTVSAPTEQITKAVLLESEAPHCCHVTCWGSRDQPSWPESISEYTTLFYADDCKASRTK